VQTPSGTQTRRRLRAALADDADEPRIVRHPDGFYWQSQEHEVGPFASIEDARADMQAADAEAIETRDFEPGEMLHEVESEIGMADWIDPETGSPAEDRRQHIDDQ
jgi:hypothetical protein